MAVLTGIQPLLLLPTNNPPTVAISPAGGTFTAPVQVTLLSTDDKTASPEIDLQR